MASKRVKIPYDNSLNPFAEPRTSMAFSEELRNKLKQMGLCGETNKPVGIEFDDIVAASFRIRKGVGKTPCEVNVANLTMHILMRALLSNV